MKKLSDYPEFLHPLFAAIGKAMDRPQLHPGVLDAIPKTFDGFKPGDRITIHHVSGSGLPRGKGYYVVELAGSEGGLRWKFWSGELQILALEAVHSSELGAGVCEN
ncbi:hypothetical protein [Devosia sp. CAU 1758]